MHFEMAKMVTFVMCDFTINCSQKKKRKKARDRWNRWNKINKELQSVEAGWRIQGDHGNTHVTYTYPGNVRHLTFLLINVHHQKSLRIPASSLYLKGIMEIKYHNLRGQSNLKMLKLCFVEKPFFQIKSYWEIQHMKEIREVITNIYYSQ